MKMIFFLFVLAFVFVPSATQAQGGWQIEQTILSHGSSPVTSGTSGTIRIRNKNGRMVEATLEREQQRFIYGQYFGDDDLAFKIGASAGLLQNAPVVTLLLETNVRLSQNIRLGAIYWPGFFFWGEPRDWKTENDGVENLEGVFQGQFGGIWMSFGDLQLSFHMLDFLDEPPNELPGITYTRALRDNLGLSAAATWNNNDQEFMPWIGLIWNP